MYKNRDGSINQAKLDRLKKDMPDYLAQEQAQAAHVTILKRLAELHATEKGTGLFYHTGRRYTTLPELSGTEGQYRGQTFNGNALTPANINDLILQDSRSIQSAENARMAKRSQSIKDQAAEVQRRKDNDKLVKFAPHSPLLGEAEFDEAEAELDNATELHHEQPHHHEQAPRHRFNNRKVAVNVHVEA